MQTKTKRSHGGTQRYDTSTGKYVSNRTVNSSTKKRK